MDVLERSYDLILDGSDQMGGINMRDQMGDVVWSDGSGVPVTGSNGQPIIVNVPGNNGNAPYWWDGAVSLFSQALTSFGGAHTGTQVASSGNRITAITNAIPVNQQAGYVDPAYAAAYAANRGGIGANGAVSAGSSIDGLVQWVSQPTNFLIAAGAAFILFAWNREPKKR